MNEAAWVLGSRYGEDAHDNTVRALMEREQFYRDQLQAPYRDMVKYWKLYLASRDDKRLPHEKWRAHTFVPYAFSGTETSVAVLSDIFNSADPAIQAEPVGKEDIPRAKKMERILSYTQVKNRWQFAQGMHFRELRIQGTAVWKVIHRKMAHTIRVHPTVEDVKAFHAAVDMAVQRGAGQPPEDPEEFELWRTTVNTAQSFGNVPEPPQPGPKEVVEYRGPWYERPSLFDLRFDPMVESVDEQPFFFHRIVKPDSWLMERTGLGPDKPFDPAQVAAALRQGPDSRFETFDEQIADMLKIPRATGDPTYSKSVELFECWSREPGFPPYAIVLNRGAIINKQPDTLPYFHGKWPFVMTRNVAIPRRALGISDFQQAYSLYHEMFLFRDLRLDALLLAVLPVYTKMKEMGLPGLQQFLYPGMVMDLPVKDGIQLLTKPQIPAEMWREEDALKQDIDETNATPPQVRGSQATVGRVSATESQGRLNQALLRQKQSVLMLEDEMQPIPRQSAGLWYQFSDAELRLKIGGEDGGDDPFVSMSRADLLETLDIDFKFRGASKALNRELSAQQLKDTMETAHRLGVLLPEESRKILTRILETLGHKGVSEMITDAGTKQIIAASEAQRLAAAQQAQVGKMGIPSEVPVEGGPPPDAGAPPPPPEGAPPA